MPDKVDVTVEIETYLLEINDYYRKYPFVVTLMIILPIPGIFIFIKWIKKKRALDQKKMDIQNMLNELGSTIPLQEFLDMKKRFNTARKY